MGGYDDHFAFYCVLQRGWKIVYTPDTIVFHESAYVPPALETMQWAYAGAFATLLILETPSRWMILKYLLEGLFGARRPWFDHRPPATRSVLRLCRMAVGMAAGVPIYIGVTLRQVWRTMIRPGRAEGKGSYNLPMSEVEAKERIGS